MLLQRRAASCFSVCLVNSVPAVCCPWCLSADILKQPSLSHLNVQIIVRDSKASDGNDYGVENNRFPLAGADC